VYPGQSEVLQKLSHKETNKAKDLMSYADGKNIGILRIQRGI